MRIFGAIFWAVILIVIGIVIILNQVFDWHISVFAIVMGIILIFLGISVIAGPNTNSSTGVFSGGSVRSIKGGENNYVFSGVTLNLDDYSYDEKIQVNCVFSGIKINTNGKSVKIKSSGVFSNTVFPDNSSVVFGERIYERDGENTIEIETNCVFGSIEIN